MKSLIVFAVAYLTCLNGYSQQSTATRTRSTTNGSTNPTNTSKTVSKQTGQPATQSVQATQRVPASATPPRSKTESAGNSAKPAQSPFVGGIHAAADAGKPMEKNTTATRTNTTNNNGASVAGGNDTTFNVNTVNQGGVSSNSGAVDRSGQSQFGQTNWGRNNRNTVGESQWTVPPPITSSFNHQFPGANSVTWQRNNVDTTQFTARYNFGGTWVTTTYNGGGDKLETRTEIPLVQAPRPVSVYLAKQPANFRITSISRLQLNGKPQVYEVKTSTGKIIYINDDGMETQL